MVDEATGKTVSIESGRHPVTLDIVYILSATCRCGGRDEVVEVRVDEGYFWQGGDDNWIVYQFYCLCYEPEPPNDLILVDPSEWPPEHLRQYVSVAILNPGEKRKRMVIPTVIAPQRARQFRPGVIRPFHPGLGETNPNDDETETIR